MRFHVARLEQLQGVFSLLKRKAVADVAVRIDATARNQLEARRKRQEVAAREIEVDLAVLEICDRDRRPVLGKRSHDGDSPATLHHGGSVCDRALLEAADALDHLVEAQPAGCGQRAGAQLAGIGVHGVRDAEATREREAVFEQVEYRHLGAHRARDERGAEPDRARADHREPLPGTRLHAVGNGVIADPEHLHGRGLVVAHVFRQPVQVEIGHRGVLRVGPVAVEAHRLQPLADVATALAAGAALPAREIDVTADALAHAEALDRAPERDDLAGELVAQHAREGEPRVLAMVGVQVRPADRARADLDDCLVGRRRGIGQSLAPQVTAAVQHHRFHVGRFPVRAGMPPARTQR